MPGSEPASAAYRYRKFAISDKVNATAATAGHQGRAKLASLLTQITVIARTELNAVYDDKKNQLYLAVRVR